MLLRLRQICLVARDLDATGRTLTDVFGLKISIRDPAVEKHGLHNVVMPIGNTFLEVVSPFRDGTTAGRYLDRLGGDGGYMVILDCDDIDAWREHCKSIGVRIPYEANYPERGYGALHLHPRDVGATLLSIDRDVNGADLNGSWSPGGPDWQRHVGTTRVSNIVAAELQSDAPDILATRWGKILRRPVEKDAGGALRIGLDNAVLRFVKQSDGKGELLGGIDLKATDRTATLAAGKEAGLDVTGDTVHVCGMRIRLV
jgi:hypothetical protein